jgi:biopolymer transport protein ExbD
VNLRSRVPEAPEINLTSLVDVVLLLIIFFMASTTFVRERALRVELPQASPEPVPLAAPLEVTVTADGNYLVNRQALVNNSADTLRRALERSAGDRRDLPVAIRADARATHQSVVTAMDVAGRLGFVHLSIATVNSKESP